MKDIDRQARAEERRKRATLRLTRLSSEDDDEVDPHPIYGDEAVSLLTRLTREGWSLAGRDQPTYARHEIPCRCVPGRLT
jgi:hypothetical protein